MKEAIKKRPKVGVGVIVIKGKKVLLGKRKGSNGKGTWGFLGGHLEFGEEIEQCAVREVKEETGISVKNIRKVTFTNDIFEKEKKHYVTLYLVCEHAFGKVKVMEKDKFEKWEWFGWNNLPRPLFLPIKNLLKQKFNPFELPVIK